MMLYLALSFIQTFQPQGLCPSPPDHLSGSTGAAKLPGKNTVACLIHSASSFSPSSKPLLPLPVLLQLPKLRCNGYKRRSAWWRSDDSVRNVYCMPAQYMALHWPWAQVDENNASQLHGGHSGPKLGSGSALLLLMRTGE